MDWKRGVLHLSIDNSRTSVTLLHSIQTGDDPSAWNLFYSRYAHLIKRWCLAWGVPAEESDDIVQETLLNVFQYIGNFQYDPNRSFRAWLKTIAKNIWTNFQKHSFIKLLSTNSEERKLKLSLMQDDFEQSLDILADRELIQIACQRVRAKVDPIHWTAFLMFEYHFVPGPTIAKELGLSVGAIHTAICRVRKLIRNEIILLDPQNEFS